MSRAIGYATTIARSGVWAIVERGALAYGGGRTLYRLVTFARVRLVQANEELQFRRDPGGFVVRAAFRCDRHGTSNLLYEGIRDRSRGSQNGGGDITGVIGDATTDLQIGRVDHSGQR